jgi:predicted DNA-binding helix-hairpin-helix protein
MTDSRLPTLPHSPLRRAHRLYQADWLLRYYGFSASELLDEGSPNLESDLDPKTGWALRHRELFPVEINRADYGELLRVPGIGVRSAGRIVRARRQGHLGLDDLAQLGVVLKRARYFITARGRYGGDCSLESTLLRSRLLATPAKKGNTQLALPFYRTDTETAGLVSGEL